MTWALIGLGVLVTLPLVIIGAGFLVMMLARPGLGGRGGRRKTGQARKTGTAPDAEAGAEPGTGLEPSASSPRSPENLPGRPEGT